MAATSGKLKPVTVIHFPKVQSRPRDLSTISVTAVVPERDDEATEPYSVVARSAERPSGPRRKVKKTRSREFTPARSARAPRPAAPSDEEELAALGHRLFEKGKLPEARTIFERLVSAHPTNAFVHTMLGTVYLALNAQDRALALFHAALKLDPDDVAALVYRGEIRLNRGKLRAAMEDLSAARAVGEPGDPFVSRATRLLKMVQGALRKKEPSLRRPKPRKTLA